MPHDFFQFANHVPLIGLLANRMRESMGDKTTKFVLSGGLGVVVVAVVSWGFSVEYRIAKHEQSLIENNQDIKMINSELSEINNKQDKTLRAVESIEAYLTNKYDKYENAK